MIDLAIGFTVGAAFTTVVKSLVNDIIMPPIGLVLGSADFSDLFVVLKAPDAATGVASYETLQAAQQAGAVTLNYGVFISNCIALFIVALAMFVIIRAVNRVDEQLEAQFGGDKPEPEQPNDKKCPYCRSTIPFKASRCPHCTSQLLDAEASADETKQ